MGTVYRARDTRLGRSVAVKICRCEFGDRFEREARAVAALNHPNICTLHDVGPNYLVMELVEGPTLAERMGQGPVPLEEALGIARQIGDALEAAHERGIVHRDLKPGNVKIKPDGAVKVLDFGLAKLAITPDSHTGEAPAEKAGTEAGMILGTVAYMSPEQARGGPIDKRADIWAFGVVLFEMLTGRRLFEGRTVSDTLAAVLRQEPEWDGVPKTAQRLLRSCLEKDPRRRLRDIGDAWTLLDDAPEELPRRRGKWIAWAALSSLLAGLAAWALLRTPPAAPRPVSRWTVTLSTPPPRIGLGIALSRDGTRMAYAEQVGGSTRLVVRGLNEREGKPIAGTEGGLRPFFSPDGRWLAYFSGSSGPIKKVPVTGGSSTVLCDTAHFTGGHWNDDDSIIFAGGDGRLFRVAASGGACEKLNTPQGAWPQVLPGSRSMLFTIGSRGQFDAARVAVFDLKSGALRTLVNAGTQARYVPSGHLVYARSGTLFAVPFDLKRLAVTGPEAAVIEEILYFSGGGYAEYAFSDSGLLVYMDREGSKQLGTLEWLDRKGASQPALAPARDYGMLRLSPDGRRVAIVTSSAVGGSLAAFSSVSTPHSQSPRSRRRVWRTNIVG
jgi:serine/threonine-protein kinase